MMQSSSHLLASPLRSASLQPATFRAYSTQFQHFLDHIRLPLHKLLRHSTRTIDILLARYIDQLYSENGSFAYACHTVNGLIFHSPRLKHRLHESRLRLRGWDKIRISASHPPITWEITLVISLTLAKQQLTAEAVACLLAFDCFLRVGELTSLRYSDIVQPLDDRLGSAHERMALRLAHTKTGRNQWVSIADPHVEQVFQLYLRSRAWQVGDHVFPFSSSRFRRSLRQVCAQLGLAAINYVPHSFRHGGATRANLLGESIEQIMLRGRWKRLESARRYIQTGRSLLTLQQIPPQLQQIGNVLQRNLVAAMRHFLPRLVSLAASPSVVASKSNSKSRRVRFA